MIAANPTNGQAHLLLCRAYYSERRADEAVTECEAALQTLSRDSNAQDWMGKAYGMKAEHAGPLSGYSLAKKVKSSFEAAFALNPANVEAIDDLGDYYIEAPGIVGGGMDKAKALAQRVEKNNRESALRLYASIAEQQKDYDAAENALKEHVRATKGRPDTWLDLADFYRRRGETDKAVEAVHQAKANIRQSSASLMAVAEILHKLQREPAVAIAALREYLSGSNTDDSAPPFKAHVLLGKMEAEQGNKSAAKMDFNQALSLAPDYEPAKKALASL